jgi:hypothetical protein
MIILIQSGAMSILLWYYFTLPKEDPPHVEPPLLRQNLGAKTIWVANGKQTCCCFEAQLKFVHFFIQQQKCRNI